MDRAVVFDIGGVLERTPDRGVRRAWERRLGLSDGALDARLSRVWSDGAVGRITERESRDAVQRALGLSTPDLEAFLGELWEEYLGTPSEPLLELLRGLDGRVVRGICSNSFVGAREREEVHLGLSRIADVVVYSHEVGVQKPDPAMYALTTAALGVPAERVLFVDDLEENVRAACLHGMHGLLHVDEQATAAAVLRFVGG